MALHSLPLALLLVCALGCQDSSSGRGLRARDDDTAALTAAALARATDPAAKAGAAALAERRPWAATLALAPALSDSSRRTPEVLLLAATAASQWGGWEQVEQLLTGASWIDTLADGRGRTLLTMAALQRNADSVALEHARIGKQLKGSAPERALRAVLHARALDRLGMRDSSRVAYTAAAEMLPTTRDWLLLRAAGVTPDSARRAEYYERLENPAARDRVPLAEATTLERLGQTARAAEAHEALGNRASALRLRLYAASGTPARNAIRRQLLALVTSRPGSAEARTATEVLDDGFGTLTAAEELAIARSASRGGPMGRAATGYARAFKARLGTSQDRFDYGNVLLQLNRDRQAAQQYALVKAPASLAGDAAYQRARALLRAGSTTASRNALRAILKTRAGDTSASSSALLLLGDLATDDGRDVAARTAFRDLARRYPTSPHAASARFRAAIIAYASGNPRTAAAEMDTIWTRFPRSSEALAAGYWSGRGWARAGDSARAAARWREVIQRDPISYYSMLSARRLGEAPWAPPARADSFPSVPTVDSAMARASLLERLGMDLEARLEYERAGSPADSSIETLLATANAFRDRELSTRAISLGWRIVRRGENDARAYRLVYPLIHRDALISTAAEHRLDASLMAAIIRQESSFNPRATSGPGARGLMQVMPSLGAALARSLRFPTWDPALLYEPDVNIQLGAIHLRDLDRTYSQVVHLLAAYNAGGSRVTRWKRKQGVTDPELFVERIPFVETRDYVRIVLRNQELYRSLYELR